MAVDGELDPQVSSLQPPPHAEPDRPTLADRGMALLEVLICSGYPTQFALAATFAALGFAPMSGGQLNLTNVVLVSLADTVLLLGLIAAFLAVHGERSRELLLGGKPIGREARAGVPLALVALILGLAVLYTIDQLAPWLRNVPENPLQNLVRTPRDAVMFALVVVIAGGVREESQRAFLLQRFERWLGGGGVGVVVTSLSFGVGHIIQGFDAALTTGVLGAFWGIVYLRRRSVLAPVVSHSGFNLLQLSRILTGGV
jgi:membrane protease YdiL (CAAX protease family)